MAAPFGSLVLQVKASGDRHQIHALLKQTQLVKVMRKELTVMGGVLELERGNIEAAWIRFDAANKLPEVLGVETVIGIRWGEVLSFSERSQMLDGYLRVLRVNK